MWGPMMGYGYGYGSGWMMAANSLFWVVVLALAAIVVWRLAGRPVPGHSAARGSAREILEERYARGEIERDEYLQKRGDLLTAGASSRDGNPHRSA